MPVTLNFLAVGGGGKHPRNPPPNAHACNINMIIKILFQYTYQ